MLITGVPGIGKTSFTSWLANEYKDDDRVIVLRFRDWKKKELEKGLLNAICNKFCCENEDLEDRILILDGFDEMKALDIRERLLNDFASDIKDFENFKCIITSRPAYIKSSYFQVVIKLSEFDEKKIAEFYRLIRKSNLSNMKKISSNLAVLGIPVILYMAIMLDIDISENPTKPELYERIFAEDGGIFDKFFDGENQYSEGLQLMRNPDNIKDYLEYLRNVAYMMFERNNLSLDIEECEIPKLDFNSEKISILEFPIKHFFETTEINIEFIHKSIYDYFVSEYIFMSMFKGIKQYKDTEYIAGVLGELLKSNYLSPDIIEFLRYRVTKSNLNEKFNIVNGAFEIMLNDGMTYYTQKRYKNVMDCEMKILANMLEILHIWDRHDLIISTFIGKYLKYGIDVTLNLQGMKLSKMELGELDFSRINLKKTQLQGINLENANFEGKNLEEIVWKEANLIGANLNEAGLRGANLEGSDLSEAKLSGAVLLNSILKKVDLIGANLENAVLNGADLSEASLYGANLVGAQLDNVKFDDANINYSIWTEADVYRLLYKLRNTVFKYIIIERENGEKIEVCRNKLF